MKKTLRNTLLIWFLGFSVVLILVFIAFNALYIHQKSRITSVIGQIYELHLDVQKDFNITDAFFTYEASNLAFFGSQKSTLLDDHEQRVLEINDALGQLRNSRMVARMDIQNAIDSLSEDFGNYVISVDQIVQLILKRGIKDYGIVGKMRAYVHQLELFEELDQRNVLNLRRHEKDYIIRNERQYVTSLNELGSRFREGIIKDPGITRSRKDAIIFLLDNYLEEFNNLVEVDRQIGLKNPESGTKSQLDELEIKIERRFNHVINTAESRKTVLFRYLEIFYAFSFFLFLLVSMLLSRVISGYISAPLTTLTGHIKKLSENNLAPDDHLEQNFNNYESSVLYREFRNLMEQIKKEKEDLNKVQAALIENEEKYRQLADNLPQSVFETDQFGNLTYVNSNWQKSFSYTKEEVQEGLNIITILKAKNGPIVLGNEAAGPVEYIARKKDGTTFPVLVYTNRIHRDNKLMGFRGAILDISDRKLKMS
jgi:PAS domain S-box-containing protein